MVLQVNQLLFHIHPLMFPSLWVQIWPARTNSLTLWWVKTIINFISSDCIYKILMQFNDKQHLAKLLRKLLPLADLWKMIGQFLEVPRLDTIEANNARVDARLRDMLSTWLKQVNPQPTKGRLVEAIAAYDPTLAQEINNMFP